jgi:hypothetical protein
VVAVFYGMNFTAILKRFGCGISLVIFPSDVDDDQALSIIEDNTDCSEYLKDCDIPTIFYVLERSGDFPGIFEKRMSESDDFERMTNIITSQGSHEHQMRLAFLQERYKSL